MEVMFSSLFVCLSLREQDYLKSFKRFRDAL